MEAVTRFKGCECYHGTHGCPPTGLPSPVAVPLGYFKVTIDLKECFFTIPLYPDDQKRFAFSLPSINFKEPTRH